MVDKPKKVLSPTEAALSAIQKALKVEDEQPIDSGSGAIRSQGDNINLGPTEIPELAAWLRLELRNLATRLDQIASVSAVIERLLTATNKSSSPESESKQSQGWLAELLEKASDAPSASKQAQSDDISLKEVLSFLSAGSENSEYPVAEPNADRSASRQATEVDLEHFAERLERDLVAAAVSASHRPAQHPGEEPRELDYRELAFRLHRDLLELVTNSPNSKIRDVAARAQAIARKQEMAERRHSAPAERSVETPTARILRIGELPNDVVTALRRVEMNPCHAHLDKLLEE